MNKIVLRHSRKSLIFSVMVGALGITTLAAMLPLAIKDGVGPVVLVVLVGGTFAALGVYGVLKSAHDRITIYSFGIAKNSAPRGARTFQCNWDEVMDYSWSSNTGVFEAGSAGASVYVLTSPRAQLRINTYSDCFPRLHSYILTRIPERAEVHLQRTEVSKSIRCDETRDFRRSSLLGNAGNVLAFLLMTVVGAFFMISPWTDQSDWGPPFAFKLAFATLGAFVLYIGGSRLIGTFKRRASDAIRISRSGVTAIWGGKKGRHIPWNEVRAVQYLYYLDHSDKNGSSSRRRNRISFRTGPRFQYFYAIIGADGKVMRFNSWMRDFAPFVSALVDHVPAAAGISLHDPLDKLR